MKDAAEELRREVSEEYDENTVCDTAVSVDGYIYIYILHVVIFTDNNFILC